MTRFSFNLNLTFACFIWVSFAAVGRLGLTEEPVKEFLNGLRELEYFDMALEYLDRMEPSRVVNDDFKQTVLYERAVTLIQASRHQLDPAVRQQQLNDAQAALQKFVDTHKTHHLVSSANNQQADLLVERARMNVDVANRPTTIGLEKGRLLEDARKLFDEAHNIFAKSQASLKEMLQKIPPRLDPNDPDQRRQITVRDQYREDYLQARLTLPGIKEEKADTYPENAPERNKLLTEAADEYKQAYDDYRTRIAGLYAKMNRGRCYVKLKDYAEALSLFGDLLEQPNEPEAFRTLKKRTLILAVDCWLGDSEKKLYHDAILRLGAMIDQLRPNEAREPEWLYLRLALARAYQAYADDVENRKEKATALNNARTHASFVGRYESQYKREAQEFLAAMRGTTLAPDEQREPATFADARKAGKETLESWQTAQLTVANLKGRIAQAKNANERADLEKQLNDTLANIQEHPAKSLNYFRLALQLADDQTSIDDLNVVRYFLSFWYFTLGDYYDAALVGEFVARRYPGSPGASQCAQIAIAAYLRLYRDKPYEDKQFETQRITGIGDYILETWPDRAEAVVAANTLIAFMINDQKLDKAIEYLERIPVESPQRGAAELSTGQALWSYYLQQSIQLNEEGPPADTTRATVQARLEQVKKQAKQMLLDGIQRSRSAPVDDTLLTAALSLAQIHVEQTEAEAAVALLEDSKIGPLTLAQKNDPATQREGFAVETYKTALRAYIAALKPRSDNKATIDKAKAMMASLKQRMGDAPEGRKALVANYIKLATDIKQQLDATPLEQKKTLATGFASFLREVRGEADELTVQIWAADSFSKLGENFRGGATGDSLPPEAAEYFAEAVKGFQSILDKAKAQPDWLPDDVRLQVLVQMAFTNRQLGKYQEAIDLFEEVLRDNPSMLTIQVEAAKTCQEWAVAAKDAQRYAVAMMGDRKDQRSEVNGERNKNYLKFTIWGWGRLSQVTAGHEQYRDVFHEARYNLALCRFEYAKLQSAEADRKKWKEAAKRDITYTQQLFPNLGGSKWQPKYDKLIRDIQQSLGEPVVGLSQSVSAGGVKR